jgi:hypothetical protein
VVPRNACVTSAAKVGAGQVQLFNRDSRGVDVDWRDERQALPNTTRIVVDGDVGVGQLGVTYDDPDTIHGPTFALEPGNAACIGGARG